MLLLLVIQIPSRLEKSKTKKETNRNTTKFQPFLDSGMLVSLIPACLKVLSENHQGPALPWSCPSWKQSLRICTPRFRGTPGQSLCHGSEMLPSVGSSSRLC
mmetsp:Transcript_69811/g.160500  ORF Transcript_69811/g.160500 Transcript_69811/m.160500 type:complete len:102 (+) Transcript_69811:234-539(+)